MCKYCDNAIMNEPLVEDGGYALAIERSNVNAWLSVKNNNDMQPPVIQYNINTCPSCGAPLSETEQWQPHDQSSCACYGKHRTILNKRDDATLSIECTSWYVILRLETPSQSSELFRSGFVTSFCPLCARRTKISR